MKWYRRGLIFNFEQYNDYFYQSAMLPIPKVCGNFIRFYIAGQDINGVGRPTFIDCNINNFHDILYVNKYPLLDIGFPGTFDQDGCVPLSLVELPDGKIFLYYVGFELGTRARYRMLTGLAVSEDGISFKKYGDVPILERCDGESLFRCGPYVIHENGLFRMWYVAGDSWSNFSGKDVPNYKIRYMESKDGIHWGSQSIICIDVEHYNEHGFGRPFVFRHDGIYKMIYSIRINGVGYRLGYAESKDGISWNRMDDKMNFDVAEE